MSDWPLSFTVEPSSCAEAVLRKSFNAVRTGVVAVLAPEESPLFGLVSRVIPPFVGGNVGGIPLQVEDGVSGFLVDSVEVCAQRTLEILRDPELGKQLGRTGKEHVRKHFLTPRYLRDYLRIFTELLGEDTGRDTAAA